MCGISGFSWEDTHLIRKITDCISHRGPDSKGYFTDKDISLGHRRLAIIDLSSNGNQPMFSEDNNLAIVFNGEIYNFKDLKSVLENKGHKFSSGSDTEVILAGYSEYGEKICSKLDGMFAFAIWDKKSKELFLARDRIGKKPLYYSINDGKLVFSSEIKSILKAGVSNSVDKDILLKTVMSRFSPGNKTVFSNIKKLPPSSYALFKSGKLKISNYWSLPLLKEKNDASTKEVDILLENAVEKRLISDVPVGVLLSGGLDSSAIVSYMKRKTDKIKTFSVGFKEGMDESKYARLVANHFKTEHTEIILEKDILSYLPEVIYHMDEPISDPASLPTYLLCKEVSKRVKVALSGEGGDEVFGGYDTVNRLELLKKLDKKSKLLKNFAAKAMSFISSFNKYPKKQIYLFGAEIAKSKDIYEAYKKLYYFPFNADEMKLFSGKDIPDIIDDYKEKDLYKTSVKFYFSEWLPNDLLMKVDKMSMASGLEVRAPFLDKDLIETILPLKRKYKINKSLFRQTVSPHLPKAIVNRKKQGFSLPISTWFTNGDFLSRVSPHIEDLKKRGLFHVSEIDKLIKNPTKYRNDHKLWTLLNLELWYKIYIDKMDLKKVIV